MFYYCDYIIQCYHLCVHRSYGRGYIPQGQLLRKEQCSNWRILLTVVQYPQILTTIWKLQKISSSYMHTLFRLKTQSTNFSNPTNFSFLDSCPSTFRKFHTLYSQVYRKHKHMLESRKRKTNNDAVKADSQPTSMFNEVDRYGKLRPK